MQVRGDIMSENNTLLEVSNLSKIYQMGEVTVPAVKNVGLKVYRGEFIVILGPSGSGKSTLLNIIGGMDMPSEGKVIMDGEDIIGFNDKEMTYYRRDKIGFVFQFYNLMATLTAKENVELATEICKNPLDVDEVLELVGLGDRKDHFPSQMSGGEQQRIAIARAVAKNADLLLCDEPTGALDFETGIKILGLLKEINEKYKKTVMIITHNTPIGEMANRVIKMRSGEIIETIINEKPVDPERIVW